MSDVDDTDAQGPDGPADLPGRLNGPPTGSDQPEQRRVAIPTGRELVARIPLLGLLLERTEAAGLALDGVYLVGGAVRDAILAGDGLPTPVFDLDLAVEGAASETFAELLAAAIGGEVIAEHRFGTATVLAVLVQGAPPVRIDVAACRTETYAEPGALPEVTLGATIAEDLARRDFTANAVAVALAADADGNHLVVDPYNGMIDIFTRLLRGIHDQTFHDDPTRIMRLARYSGRLRFPVEPATRELAVEAVAAGAIQTISADRMRQELELILEEAAWDPLTLLAAWGVLDTLDARLEESFRLPFLVMRIDEATAGDVDLSRRVWKMRLGALTIGLGDDVIGWLRWLGFPGDVIAEVDGHVRLLRFVRDQGDDLLTLANSDLYLELGEVVDDSFALAALAEDEQPRFARLDAYRIALRDTALTLRGEDVMAAGIAGGPEVGRILGTLFLRALDGELPTPEAERAALGELVAQSKAGGSDEADAGTSAP
ncbi:MAG: Polynucleotide adenylyltransferase region [Thermoleophilia bacterium]|nr:Polynucleotide adenylyltransferase region [Thermoleophilia bacterium]